jgi:hypothetical protein
MAYDTIAVTYLFDKSAGQDSNAAPV